MTEWVDDAVRRYWLAWLQDHIDRSVVDLFGYHAVQIGEPDLDGLRANRMPYRWKIDPAGQLDAVAEALPFKDRSLDLVLLPHTLERSVDPHQALREVERVLVPEGRVVIAGLNPFSAWSLSWWSAVFFALRAQPRSGWIGVRGWMRRVMPCGHGRRTPTCWSPLSVSAGPS